MIALPHSQTLVVELDTTFVLGLQVKAVIIPYLPFGAGAASQTDPACVVDTPAKGVVTVPLDDAPRYDRTS